MSKANSGKPKREKPSGPCCICGVDGPLTYEHVPPKKAFNGASILTSRGEDLFTADDPESVRKSTQRMGAGGYTLCARCNNVTGSYYGPAYVDWAHQGMRYWEYSQLSLSLPFYLFPLRVAKQIMSMFASTCGPGLFEKNPHLRKFVLDRETRGLPEHMRLFCYMLTHDSTRSRSTGIVGQLSGSRSHTYAETSFIPFGYILALGSPPPDPQLLDITFFAHQAWNDWRDLHLRMPRRSVHTYFPGDFRSASEWEEALEAGRLRRSMTVAEEP